METMQDAEGLIDASPAVDYRVVVTGPGVNVDRPATEEAAFQVISVVMGVGTATRASAAPSPVAASPSSSFAPAPLSSGQANLSVGEFISEVEAKTNADKILAFGVYLTDHLGSETFTRDDIRALFQPAGEAPPANYPRDFKVAISSKWIAEVAGKPNQFYVTGTGRRVVQDKFSEESVKKTRQVPRPRRRGKDKDTDGEDEAGDAR